MKRRAFITLLLAVRRASWPLAAPAQQADCVRRIGVLMNNATDDSEARSEVSAFTQQDPCTD